jgi:hypothetical protein
MKLFKMKDWQLQVEDETWGIPAFGKLLTRDKSKDKTKALKEMMFIWHYSDIKSDYQYITDLDIRAVEIRKDLLLPDKWVIDKTLQAAIDLYEVRSTSIIETLYKQTLQSASAIGEYLGNSKALLSERDVHGKVVTDIAKITASVQKIPKLMDDLKVAYKEVVKEQEDMDNRKKGSRTMNPFEEGFKTD